mmetsp:Transcript_12507/g.14245  ORF Transcript_12507/g.14245 Transcript_12507/m.14245 type:complete len:138 (+) Transcript_12507:36-449(+)
MLGDAGCRSAIEMMSTDRIPDLRLMVVDSDSCGSSSASGSSRKRSEEVLSTGADVAVKMTKEEPVTVVKNNTTYEERLVVAVKKIEKEEGSVIARSDDHCRVRLSKNTTFDFTRSSSTCTTKRCYNNNNTKEKEKKT